MSFDDSFFSRDDRYSLGVQSTLGKYYASFPVSSGFVDYYRILRVDLRSVPCVYDE